MTKLSETNAAINWLRQFQPNDQILASKLLDTFKTVSYAEFAKNIQDLIIECAHKIDGPVSLYAERELGNIKFLFNEENRKRKSNRRAHGVGPTPVKPTRYVNPKIGSEGIVAQIISELCTQYPKKLYNHAGPDQIRNKKIRAFFLVTDFIGSGNRAEKYLDAAWRVSSVKSWTSLAVSKNDIIKHLKFEVITYSATNPGIRRLSKHRTKPAINIVAPCPTIDTEFSGIEKSKVINICESYYCGPHTDRFSNKISSLGFQETGSLIVFAHGCPNNAPRIFFFKSKKWSPLFPNRVTAASRDDFIDFKKSATIRKQFLKMNQMRLAKGDFYFSMSSSGQSFLLILAALRKGPRHDAVVAQKTGLTTIEVRVYIEKAIKWGWVNKERYVLDPGIKILNQARSIKKSKSSIPTTNEILYYPKSLRVPI